MIYERYSSQERVDTQVRQMQAREPDSAQPCQNLSPMMRQYKEIKAQHPEALLFFRLGDFYELFEADAQVAARELDITLTGRPEPGYQGGRIPMAGVPFRSAEVYLSRLLSRGYSIAICEQTGVVGSGKGPVERQVTRVLTPGTVLESSFLPARQNNYLISILKGGPDGCLWGLACVDASCGEFFVSQMPEDRLILEIERLKPSEILAAKRSSRPLPGQVVAEVELEIPARLKQYRLTGRPAMFYQVETAQRRIMQLFGVSTLEGFGCQSMPLALGAAGALMEYLEKTQGSLMPKFNGISVYASDQHLVLDANTCKHLELTETARDGSLQGSLLWALDHTRTAMGSRTLRRWLLKPLYSVEEIVERQDSIAELIENPQYRLAVAGALAELSDLERAGVKLSSGTILPNELVAVSHCLSALPALSEALSAAKSRYLSAFSQLPAALMELNDRILSALRQEAPRELTEGGIFRSGYSKQLDELRSLAHGGKQWMESFQKSQQEATGIRSLKVAVSQTFGYYIEITNANKDAVPPEYMRKQTLTNAERYITPELKDYETKILNAERQSGDLEYQLYNELRQSLSEYGAYVCLVARQLSELDALLCLSELACERNFVRPLVDESAVLEIYRGRHPVLERIIPTGLYVANDSFLQAESNTNQLIILTGPNMSGKSSYLRQVALMVVLAQMGSYVPAERARIGLVDRIFTRIGAVDDLSQGQSTFLVEMSETTQCCLSATARSLILLDEVGRGTSTYDGVAIAWATAEYLACHVMARTIFATHYHELNTLADFFPQIANYQVLVRQSGNHVEFLRCVVPGGASKSYGIHVARMAGMPGSIIDRASSLMTQMQRRSSAVKILDAAKSSNLPAKEAMQLCLFSPENPPATYPSNAKDK